MDDIERILGARAAAYARNKNRGGLNNARGASYETYYAAARIIQLMAQALRDDDDGEETVLEEQRKCFVDDLIVEKAGRSTYSQIKSGDSTSWNSGKHTIADDFRLQTRLDNGMNIAADYELVVPDAALKLRLDQARPADVEATVVHFAAHGSAAAFAADRKDLWDDLDAIAIRPRPSTRAQVMMTVMGVWAGTASRITLAELARQASSGPGPVIGALGAEYELPGDVRAVLEAIDGLDFGIRRQHLWVRFGNFWGQSEFRCGTDEFTRLERFLVDNTVTDGIEVIQALRGVE